MKFLWSAKKIIIALIILLISCDVSLLLAAQTDFSNANTQQQLEQIRQLRSQLQQQQQQSPTNNATPTGQVQQQTQQNATVNAFGATSQPQAAQQNLNNQNNNQNAPPTLQPATQAANVSPNNANTGMVSEAEISEQAFNDLTRTTLPMTPEQIQRLRQLFNQTQFAAAALPGVPPRPLITSQFVNLSPGTTPPVVRLQQGMVSVLGFIDATGAPWPIESYDIGNPAAFNIQWNKSDNSLIIQPLTLYTYGNLAVKLQGLATPVMLMLIPGQRVFDGRLDLHIPLYGPNAVPAAGGSGLPNSADPELLGILDGVAPPGSVLLQITGGPGQAWAVGNRLFVRTRLTLLSPAWVATLSSADGMKAYELPRPTEQTPTLLVSQDGKVIQLKIEGL